MRLGKPLFEKWFLYMGIAQIAFDPPTPLSQTGTLGFFFRQTWGFSIKVPQAIRANVYTSPPNWQCLFERTTFQQKGSLRTANES